MEDNLHLIKIFLDGKYQTFDLTPLVSFSNRDINELSLEEIDSHLEKISAYRVSILVLKEKIDVTYQIYKETLDKWIAENYDEVLKIIIKNRLELKEELGNPNSWFGSITKDEVRRTFLSHNLYKERYHELVEKVREYRKSLNIISGVIEILEDRGSQLQSILKSKTKRMYK